MKHHSFFLSLIIAGQIFLVSISLSKTFEKLSYPDKSFNNKCKGRVKLYLKSQHVFRTGELDIISLT